MRNRNLLSLTIGLRREWRRVGKVLTGHWLVGLAGALAVSLLIWFPGPLLSLWGIRPFEEEAPRLGAVLGVMVAWGLFNQLRRIGERKTNRLLSEALIEAASPTAQFAGATEVGLLHRRLSETLTTYAENRGSRSLVRLPWYLLIGAPGAGKTTALANSGLEFPLADILGHHPIQGLAGTRTCDWWLTAEAGLVDTAGRYATQDSDPRADSAAWLGLLDVLKHHRPEQPVNGILLVVSVDDLIGRNPLERQLLAASLAGRLAEIEDHIDLRLPVYLILTKTDRLAGFSEFFFAPAPAEAAQVWGMTFAFERNNEGVERPATGTALGIMVNEHFGHLSAGLERRMFARLKEETDPVRRRLLAGFPHQFASLRAPLTEFLALAFLPEDRRRLFLRGLYFTSAKREGRTVDRLASEMTGSFGIEPPNPVPVSIVKPAPGLFLTRLFRDLIFAEAHLAERNTRQGSSRLPQPGNALLAAILVLSLLLGTLWGRAWLIAHGTFGGFTASLEHVAALLPPVGGNPDQVTDGNPAPVLPALNVQRAMRDDPRISGDGRPFSAGLLSDIGLDRLAAELYRRALHRLLLPRLVLRLEEVSVRVKPSDTPGAAALDTLYEALRVYLMLTGEVALDRYAVTRWFTLDWITALPGPEHETERRQLSDHLLSLLESGMPTVSGSAAVKAEARRHLMATYPLDERGYALVRALPEIEGLPGWYPLQQAGTTLTQVLSRKSGRLLTEPMPGLYTAEGARRTVLPAIARVSGELAQEAWVLGLPMDMPAVAARARRLRHDMTVRYFNDYTARWQGFLAELTPVVPDTLARIQALTAAAGGASSPLAQLIAAVVREVRPAPPEPPTAPKPGANGATTPLMLGLPAGSTVITPIQAATGDDDPALWWPVAAEVSARFHGLQVLVLPAAGRNPAPLPAALTGITEINKALGRWIATGGKSGVREARDELRRATDHVRELAAPLPPPVSNWFAGIADAADTALSFTNTIFKTGPAP
ncbi:MAG: type VI secretion system membrane subunit TssM [Rhodospirillaceae bacterium]